MIKYTTLILMALGLSCQIKQQLAQCPDGQSFDNAALTCVDPPSDCSPDSASGLFAQCGEANRECSAGGLFGSRCGKCLDGYKEDRGVCRPVSTCASLGCTSKNRECVPHASNIDAKCTSCRSGTSEVGDKCVTPSCNKNVPGSISDSCMSQHRVCADAGNGASCGQCSKGYTSKLGTCVPVSTCSSLDCAGANRLCAPGGDNTDASCGGCKGGYSDANGQCLRRAVSSCDPMNTDNILSQCGSEQRDCSSNPGGAVCGACVTGYVQNGSTMLCDAVVTCASLDCATKHRECEDTPNGRCTTCEPGFIEDVQTGVCRPVVTCSQLTCPVDEACYEATDSADARCQTGCAQGALWNGTRCEPCPPCNAAGESGRLSTPTESGACICQTQPGYFYSLAADVGTFQCDADGDGWVRESARNSIESTDPLLRQNARCDLRKIDRFVLTNEAAQTKEVALQTPLALYETDRNDDDEILAAFWAQRGLPNYGASTIVSASAINRLTKLCHHPRTDYNDNSVPDVEEWSDRDLAAGFRADQRPFNVFAYFAELNTGRYVAPTVGQTYGRYVVQEKSRLTTGRPEAERVSINYAPTDQTHWRTCDTDRDSTWSTQSPPVGMDFAKYPDDAGFKGLTLHSQFKCVVIDALPVPTKPWTRSPTDVTTQGLRLNRCEQGVNNEAQTLNPLLPDVDCTYVDSATAQPGDVRWAAIPYIDYGPNVTPTTYVRGCVNDCIVQLPLCPFYNVNPLGVTCSHDVTNFGNHLGCNAFEVCDGLDNDGVGGADNGNPGGGFVCSTGQAGVCAGGHTNCVSGDIECTRDIAPSPEVCDNLDNDCTLGVDNGNPGSGVACSVGGKSGACANGIRQCQAGGNLNCIQTVFPVAEICNNSVDDNCDGNQNEGENLQGCTDYYYDFDGDGWGIQASKKCLCAPDVAGKFTARAKRYDGTVDAQPFAFDCCDNSTSTFPGSTTLSGSVNACSSFDYNCNGLEDKEYTTTSSGGCGTCCSGFCCCDGSAGWSSGITACGTSATWNTGGCGGWSTCPKNQEQRAQRCR